MDPKRTLTKTDTLVDKTRRMNPSRHLSNRLKVKRNLWLSRDDHRVRFVGFYPLERIQLNRIRDSQTF
jgi:hypothetical protein